MKRIHIFSLFLIIGILLLNSCAKKTNHMNVIPADTYAVIVINPIDFDTEDFSDNLKKNEEYQDVLESMREDSETLAKIFEDFIQNPESAGIDMKNEIYLFFAPLEEKTQVGVVFKLGNPTNLEKLIIALVDEWGLDAKITDENGLKQIKFPTANIIWDKEKVLLLGSTSADDLSENAKQLIAQKQSESILTNTDFNIFYKECLSMNLWISTNISNMKSEIDMASGMVGVKLTDNFIHLHLDWNKTEGLFTMLFKLKLNEEIREMEMNKIMDILEGTDLFSSILNRRLKNSSQNSDEEWEDEYMETYKKQMDEISEEEMDSLLNELEKELEKLEE
jgi:hypothetical protein